MHAGTDLRPFLVEETTALRVPEPGASARCDEHADTALDHDQPLVLEALVGLGHGQGIGLFLRRKGADRGQGVSIGEAASKDRIGDGLAEADVNGFFVLLAKRHAVVIQRVARLFNHLSPNCHKAGGAHAVATVSSGGRSRSSSSRPAWPMKTKPAMRSPGPQNAAFTRSE